MDKEMRIIQALSWETLYEKLKESGLVPDLCHEIVITAKLNDITTIAYKCYVEATHVDAIVTGIEITEDEERSISK